MKWSLSDNHLSGWYIHPPSVAAAEAQRTLLRAEYRALSLRAHQTADLAERAVLQASAAAVRQALYASGGAFDGAVLAALVEGDEQHTYDDGDSAPLHCTICFLGSAADLSAVQRQNIISTAARISEDYGPFEAAVTSDAQFGDTPVRLVESSALADIHDDVLANRTIADLSDRYNDHPHFVPHVSGLDDRDTVRFDRIAAMLGGDIHTFDLNGQTTDADADLLKQGV